MGAAILLRRRHGIRRLVRSAGEKFRASACPPPPTVWTRSGGDHRHGAEGGRGRGAHGDVVGNAENAEAAGDEGRAKFLRKVAQVCAGEKQRERRGGAETRDGGYERESAARTIRLCDHDVCTREEEEARRGWSREPKNGTPRLGVKYLGALLALTVALTGPAPPVCFCASERGREAPRRDARGGFPTPVRPRWRRRS